MSEPMYTIKPLEWKPSAFGESASTPVGEYYVSRDSKGHIYWSALDSEGDQIDCGRSDSFPSAQSAAFAHYTARMREGLEEMKPPHIGYAGESFPIVPSMMKPACDCGKHEHGRHHSACPAASKEKA